MPLSSSSHRLVTAWALSVTLATILLGSPRASAAAPQGGPSEPGVAFDLQGYLDAELTKGSSSIVVPPGRYRVTPRNRVCLTLKDVRDVSILCDGVEMICTETTRALSISNCVGVTVRGLSIDYDPLPFTQGRIVALSADKSVQDIELIDGYPRSDTATTFKYEIFRPDTRTYRCGEYDIETPAKPDPQHLRITRRGSNANDPEQVGDIIAIGSEFASHGSIPHTVEVADSKGVQLEDISVYASNCFGFLDYNCDGTTYYRCKVDRRPLATDLVQRADPRIRSLNADAFHSICAVKGPAYIECAARFMGDDCINIHGDYHLVTATTARILRVLSKQRGGINIAAGDKVELLSYDGRRLPDAQVANIEPDAEVTEAEQQFLSAQGLDARTKEYLTHAKTFRITLDREVDLPMGSAICATSRTGNGFVVRGCDFGFNRSRGILIKASDGVVEGNTLVGNVMTAIMVAPEWWWLESGSSNNVRIINNTVRDCGDVAIAVYAFGGAPAVAPAGAHNNITVRGNDLTGCPLPNILVTSTSGLDIGQNTFRSYEGRTASEWTRYRFKLLDKTLEPVMTIHCEDVRPVDSQQ
ncbi:MAG: right-handed parallel beta-helix repeat-containing protein [Pirellulaceae bacterium]